MVGDQIDCRQDWLRAVTLNEWVKKHEVDTGIRNDVPTAERECSNNSPAKPGAFSRSKRLGGDANAAPVLATCG